MTRELAPYYRALDASSPRGAGARRLVQDSRPDCVGSVACCISARRGASLAFTYDGAGDRISLTDRNGNVTTYAYDANTRLASVQQKPSPAAQPALVYTTQVTRDANGNATRISQANGAATDYAYDALNRLISVSTHPSATLTLTTSYVLDGNGQPTSRTTGDGVSVSYGYDALSRLTSVSAAGLSIAYAYDELGRRTRMTDSSGTTTYTYDGLGRLTQAGSPNGALSYAYDLDGDRTRLTYPSGEAVTYAYSAGGRLTSVTDWAGRVSSYGYLASGLVASVRYPNGMLASYGYDAAQRLVAVTNAVGATTISQHSYALDAEGNRVGISEGGRLDPQDLAYDGLNRLLSIGASDNFRQAPCSPEVPPCPGTVTLESFGYDGATNITSRTGPSATYTVDGANRVTSDGTRSFTWNGADRLVQRGADAFAYDPLGRLTSSTVGGSTRAYAYNGDGLLSSGAGVGYVWDVGIAPAALLQAGSDKVVHGLGPLYMARSDGSTITFARDGLGGVRRELDGSGAITKSFAYAAYGEVAGTPTLLGFAGELRDASGLLYLRARWYDPGAGRLLTSDPLGGSPKSPVSLNRYGYAAGNPVLNLDPTGLCTDRTDSGDRVLYCIERWIPTPLACPDTGPFCGLGDDRWWPLARGGTFKMRALVKSDATVDFDPGESQLTFRDGTPIPLRLRGSLSDCGGTSSHSTVTISCVARNAFERAPTSPGPIRTLVEIAMVNGRPIVRAAGTLYPSLAVYSYGSDGPNLLYFYDGKPAGIGGLSQVGNLPNLLGK